MSFYLFSTPLNFIHIKKINKTLKNEIRKVNQALRNSSSMSAISSQYEFDSLSRELKIETGLEITRNLTKGTQIEPDSIIIPDDLLSFTLLNLEVSPFPTESRKIMKYIEIESLEKFINPSEFVNIDNYCVVFANSEDLSYHNFENILNLDHLFNNVQFSLELKKNTYFKEQQIQEFKMGGSMDTLLSLDKLNYYTVPLNNSQRGGKRLIFHSNKLSYALTQMITQSDFFDKKNFSHVNNVFRLNNFAPGDKKFKAHYDTPFADKSKDLYSKYTMLIYLTGNSVYSEIDSLPPLKIETYEVRQIEQNQCIIFDQKSEHEGNAYKDKNKIFIRTELIYKIKNFAYDEKIARMFNQACYMTKEPQQQQYSADLFNSCVKMRYGMKSEQIAPVYLAKRNLDTDYVTDGNYFWFSNRIDLKSIAILIILDYFNGKVYDLKNLKIKSKPFPRGCINEEDNEIVSDQKIFDYIGISSFPAEENEGIDIQNIQNIESFIPDSLCENFNLTFCEIHHDCGGRSALEVFQTEKEKQVNRLNRMLDDSSILIFDQTIKISYNNIQIQYDDAEKETLPSGRIKLSKFNVSTERKLNFASCNYEVLYTQKDVFFFKKKKVHSFSLPDIKFQSLPNGIKLSIDIFNNGFVYHSAEYFKQPYTDLEKANKIQKSGNQDYSENNGIEDSDSESNNTISNRIDHDTSDNDIAEKGYLRLDYFKPKSKHENARNGQHHNDDNISDFDHQEDNSNNINEEHDYYDLRVQSNNNIENDSDDHIFSSDNDEDNYQNINQEDNFDNIEDECEYQDKESYQQNDNLFDENECKSKNKYCFDNIDDDDIFGSDSNNDVNREDYQQGSQSENESQNNCNFPNNLNQSKELNEDDQQNSDHSGQNDHDDLKSIFGEDSQFNDHNLIINEDNLTSNNNNTYQLLNPSQELYSQQVNDASDEGGQLDQSLSDSHLNHNHTVVNDDDESTVAHSFPLQNQKRRVGQGSVQTFVKQKKTQE